MIKYRYGMFYDALQEAGVNGLVKPKRGSSYPLDRWGGEDYLSFCVKSAKDGRLYIEDLKGVRWYANGYPPSCAFIVVYNGRPADAKPDSEPATDETANPKDLIGVKKPGLLNVPTIALFFMGLAMKDGKEKYGRFNWREKPVQSDIYVDAALRHLLAWQDGEEVATDSGVHHLAHAASCLAIILDAQYHGKLIDNRQDFGQKVAKFIKENTND